MRFLSEIVILFVDFVFGDFPFGASLPPNVCFANTDRVFANLELANNFKVAFYFFLNLKGNLKIFSVCHAVF